MLPPGAPWLLPGLDELLDGDSLDDELLEDELLDDELLDEELLEDELLEEDEELLDDELEELDGLLGVAGGCGVVGLLALGQPASNRHRPATEPARARRTHALLWLLDFIGPHYHFCILWFSHGQPRPEACSAQRPHYPVSRTRIEFTFIDTSQVGYFTLFIDVELYP